MEVTKVSQRHIAVSVRIKAIASRTYSAAGTEQARVQVNVVGQVHGAVGIAAAGAADAGVVYKYDMSGGFVTSWAMDADNKNAEGITTDGTNIWVVDDTDALETA